MAIAPHSELFSILPLKKDPVPDPKKPLELNKKVRAAKIELE